MAGDWLKTLLFSPPKFGDKFITVNDCCWGTGELQVIQDRLLRTGSYLLLQGDEVGFLDAGMENLSWADVFRTLKELKPDRLIFQVVPQFESWQMIIAEMCRALDIEGICIGVTEQHEIKLLFQDSWYGVNGSCKPFESFLPSWGRGSWDKMPPINFGLLKGYNPPYVCTPVIQISEGCPYNCSFCIWAKKGFKMLPIDTVFANLEGYNKDVPIYLLCAQITTNKKWLEEFVERKKELNLDFEYVTDINAHELTIDKIEMLKESNCTKVMMGIESTNPDILELINKKITIEEIENAVLLCKKYGIELTCSFMYNIDPSENVDNDINFYKQFKSFNPSPGVMKIYPGTPISDKVKDYDYFMEMGTNPIATNPYLKSTIKNLIKWESVLNG